MSEAEGNLNNPKDSKSITRISPINLPNKQQAKEVINRVLAKNMSSSTNVNNNNHNNNNTNNSSSSIGNNANSNGPSGGILLSNSRNDIKKSSVNLNSSPINLPTVSTNSGSNLIQMNASPRGSYRRSTSAAAKNNTNPNNIDNINNSSQNNHKMSKISEKGMTAIQHSSSYHMDQISSNNLESFGNNSQSNSQLLIKNSSVVDLRKSNQNVSSTGNLGLQNNPNNTIKSPSHSCISNSNSNLQMPGPDRNKTPVNTPPLMAPNQHHLSNQNVNSNSSNILLRRNWKQQQQQNLHNQQNHGLISTNTGSSNQKYPPNTIIGKGHSNLNIDMCTSSNMNIQQYSEHANRNMPANFNLRKPLETSFDQLNYDDNTLKDGNGFIPDNDYNEAMANPIQMYPQNTSFVANNPTPSMMSLRGIRAPSQTMAETGMRNEAYEHVQNQNLAPPKIEEPKQETNQPPSISTQKPTQTLSAATSLKKSFNKIGDFLRTKSKEKSLEIKNQSSDLAESQHNNNNHNQASTNTNQNLPKSSIPDHHSIQNNNCDVIDEENVFTSVDQLQNSKDVYSHKFYQHQSSSNAPNSTNKVQVSSNSSSKLIARRTDIAPHNNNNNNKNNSNDNHNHNRSNDNGTPTNIPRQMDHYQQHQTQIRERGPQFINAQSQNNNQSNLNSESNLRRADEYPKRRKYDSSAMQFSPLASQSNFHMNSQNSSNQISPHYQQHPNQNSNNFSLSPVILSPNQISQVDPRTLTNNVKDSYLAVDDIEIHNEALLEQQQQQQQQQNQLSHLYQTKTDSLERENKMQNIENTNTVKNNSSNSTGKIDNNQTLENSHNNSSNNKSEKDHQTNQKPEKENKKSKKEKDGTSSTNKYSSKMLKFFGLGSSKSHNEAKNAKNLEKEKNSSAQTEKNNSASTQGTASNHDVSKDKDHMKDENRSMDVSDSKETDNDNRMVDIQNSRTENDSFDPNQKSSNSKKASPINLLGENNNNKNSTSQLELSDQNNNQKIRRPANLPLQKSNYGQQYQSSPSNKAAQYPSNNQYQHNINSQNKFSLMQNNRNLNQNSQEITSDQDYDTISMGFDQGHADKLRHNALKIFQQQSNPNMASKMGSIAQSQVTGPRTSVNVNRPKNASNMSQYQNNNNNHNYNLQKSNSGCIRKISSSQAMISTAVGHHSIPNTPSGRALNNKFDGLNPISSHGQLSSKLNLNSPSTNYPGTTEVSAGSQSISTNMSQSQSEVMRHGGSGYFWPEQTNSSNIGTNGANSQMTSTQNLANLSSQNLSNFSSVNNSHAALSPISMQRGSHLQLNRVGRMMGNYEYGDQNSNGQHQQQQQQQHPQNSQIYSSGHHSLNRKNSSQNNLCLPSPGVGGNGTLGRMSIPNQSQNISVDSRSNSSRMVSSVSGVNMKDDIGWGLDKFYFFFLFVDFYFSSSFYFNFYSIFA